MSFGWACLKPVNPASDCPEPTVPGNKWKGHGHTLLSSPELPGSIFFLFLIFSIYLHARLWWAMPLIPHSRGKGS